MRRASKIGVYFELWRDSQEIVEHYPFTLRPANTRRSPDVAVILDHRLRCWRKYTATLDQLLQLECHVFLLSQ